MLLYLFTDGPDCDVEVANLENNGEEVYPKWIYVQDMHEEWWCKSCGEVTVFPLDFSHTRIIL